CSALGPGGSSRVRWQLMMWTVSSATAPPFDRRACRDYAKQRCRGRSQPPHSARRAHSNARGVSCGPRAGTTAEPDRRQEMQRVVEAPTAPDERARLGLDRGEMARMELVAAGAGYLGLEVAELEARLEDGESMGEIAIKRGRSIQGLFDVLLVT